MGAFPPTTGLGGVIPLLGEESLSIGTRRARLIGPLSDARLLDLTTLCVSPSTFALTMISAPSGTFAFGSRASTSLLVSMLTSGTVSK